MTAISSGLYLISSLAAGDPGAGQAYSGAIVPVTIIPVVDDQRVPPAVTRMIFDLPASARASGRTLGDVVAEEVRRDPGELSAVAFTAAAPMLNGTGGDQWQAVIDAHEDRIALLKQRIATVMADAGRDGAGALEILRLRLHRAQTARLLAIARARLDGPEVACAENNEAGACRPLLAARLERPERARGSRSSVGSSHGASARVAGPASTRRSSPDRTGPARMAGSVFADNETGDARVASTTRRAESSAPAHPAPALAKVTTGPPARQLTADDHAAGDTLRHTRHLLATARALLEADVGQASPPPIVLAGLLHWDGSDRWSLADGSRNTA